MPQTAPDQRDQIEHEPKPNEIVRDAGTSRVGRIVGFEAGRYYLRPLRGGLEWEVKPRDIQAMTREEVLSARVDAENARSEGR